MAKEEKTTEVLEEEATVEVDEVKEEQVEISEEIKEETAEDKIAKLEEAVETAKKDYLRLYADFDNYRKRNAETSAKERQNGIAFALESILPAMDSIDRALSVVKDESALSGIQLIKKQFEKGLEVLGVEEIQAIGVEFDPKEHYAVMRESDPENSGKVIEVLQKGYRFKDRVLRYAMVKVAE